MARRKPEPTATPSLSDQIAAAKAAAIEACGAEIKAALERHKCRLRVRQQILDGQPMPPEFFLDVEPTQWQ